ncbi:MAG: hypothetical protein QOD99_2385 [Chthoniobacter sp.]|jgi:hypothetical protein|nr:hypothetical protein [Chthoniobacter sp.]
MSFFLPQSFIVPRRAILLALAGTSLFTAQAEPFFGGSQASSVGVYRPFYSTMRTTKVYAETAMYQPPVQHVAPPESDETAEPAVESSGSQPMVAGNRAVVRRGVAYAPSNAPDSVKRAIWAVNGIRKRPYKWGGGHGSFSDSGYDCSGTVSFALHNAGVLGTPMPSRDFLNFGDRGRGRWVTVYARRGHTFAVIAGLRLDTTDFYRGGDVGPRWYADGRSAGGFSARHPAGL